jgi:hypothetical protein
MFGEKALMDNLGRELDRARGKRAAVCTENLNSHVMVMKSAKDRGGHAICSTFETGDLQH